MITGEDIICVSSIDWDFLWQGHQEIMTRLAKGGNRVLFIENTGVRSPNLKDIGRIRSRILNWKKGIHGIRKVEDRLYVYSPMVLPFPYLRLARYINKRIILSVLSKWLKAVGFSEPVIWAFLPTGLTLDLASELNPKILLYYCIDSFRSSSLSAKKITATEKKLLERSDLVFATSSELVSYCARHNKKVYYYPFGVNIENFRNALESRAPIPDDLRSAKRPIVGYIGGIHKWIDFELLYNVAKNNKDLFFVMCGPIQSDVDKLKGLENIVFLGQKKAKELPFYVKEFDVAIIPYKLTEYTKNVYPTKLNEYLSMGKRVVSTDLPEIRRFNKENNGIVRIAENEEDFVRQLRESSLDPVSENERKMLIAAADRNSWSSRIESMSRIIEESISDKARQRENLWANNFSEFYRKAARRFVPVISVMTALYLMIFWTPLVWTLAEPLRMASTIEKSDAVAALGGGVGESGKAGQGYEEKVDEVVRLKNSALTGKIVFMSGYRYIMKEAEVMKALSVSMGVKPEDIMVEDGPVNTYEMIRRLEDLSAENGWHKVIIVSSQYHMLRVKLLCDRYMKGVKVYYLPTRESNYYDKTMPVKIRCIRGILHEYAAILTYRMKGLI